MSRSACVLVLVLFVPAASAQTPTSPEGWVVLPASEYRDLRARTLPPDPAAPPFEGVISRIDYTLRVGPTSARGEARLVVDVFRDGWTAVKIPSEGVIVRAARLDGRPTPVVSAPAPQIVVPRAGRSVVSLDVVIPVSAAPPGAALMLPPSPASVSTFVVTRGGTNEELHADGAYVAERTTAASETTWRVHGVAGRPIVFRWSPAADTRRATLPLQTRARIMEVVTLGDDVSQAHVNVAVEVVQGQAGELTLSVPEGLTVNRVSGPLVGDWSVDADRVTISLLEPLTSSASFGIDGDVRTPRDGAVTIPLVRAPDALVETGGVAVDAAGAAEIEPGTTAGLDRADPTDLQSIVGDRASPSMMAFRFTPGPGVTARSLPLTLTRYSPQAVLVANVEDASYEALAAEDGKLLVRSRFRVRNNQRSFLAVTLPGGSTLWSAALGSQPVRPGMSADGALLLPLQKGRAGQGSATSVVELLYLQRTQPWTESGTVTVSLPGVDLPVSQTTLLLHYSPRYTLDAQPGIFHKGAVRVVPQVAAPAPPAAPVAPAEKDALQALIDEAMKSSGRTTPGTIPLTIAFPEIGPALAFAAELTPEGSAPALVVDYRRSSRR